VRLGDGDGQTMMVRRITVELDKPTRDGEAEVHILTNLPAEVADASTMSREWLSIPWPRRYTKERANHPRQPKRHRS
jgi:hypothetical protein